MVKSKIERRKSNQVQLGSLKIKIEKNIDSRNFLDGSD